MSLTVQAGLDLSRDDAPSISSLGESCSRAVATTDDLSREVYGLLGIPIDALDRDSVFRKMLVTAAAGKPFLLSTPNVNFMVESKRDAGFRDSLLCSDLCCVDGMPIVWLARLFGIPVTQRVSGSDLFDTIRYNCDRSRPIKVFLFGGGEGIAGTVCKLINARPDGMRCVGWLNPGFGPIEEMSTSDIIQTINESNADLLAVFLNAKKAQSWLVLNHDRLRIPIRGQFGATINYQAGTVRRAPLIIQRLGFEWLWRIKEEPYLWRRYWKDGLSLARLVFTRAMPVAMDIVWHRYIQTGTNEEFSLEKHEHEGMMVICLIGNATKANVPKCVPFFRRLADECRNITIDISKIQSIDPRFLGLLLMLRKQIGANGKLLTITGASKKSKRMFRLNEFLFLLEPEVDSTVGPKS